MHSEKLVVNVYINHTPGHFNPTCYCNIPEYWEAYADMSEQLIEAMGGKNLEHQHLSLYGTSQDSAKDAVLDIVGQLKGMGLTGVVRYNL